MKKIIIAVSLVISLLIVSQAMAFGPGGMGACWNANLTLTAEQSAKVTSLRQKFQSETFELRKKLMVKRFEFRTLFSQPNVDESKLKKNHEELLSLQKALQEKRFDHRLAMRKILTHEQLVMLSNRQGFMGGSAMMDRGFRNGHCGRYGQGIRSGYFCRPCDN